MLTLTDPSIGPTGGSFKLKHPQTGLEFAHPNISVVYFKYREHCHQNNLPIPGVAEMDIMICQQHPEWCSEKSERSIRGLGDVVHLFASPIAKAIDAVAGTKLASCGGCGNRRAELNQKYTIGQ